MPLSGILSHSRLEYFTTIKKIQLFQKQYHTKSRVVQLSLLLRRFILHVVLLHFLFKLMLMYHKRWYATKEINFDIIFKLLYIKHNHYYIALSIILYLMWNVILYKNLQLYQIFKYMRHHQKHSNFIDDFPSNFESPPFLAGGHYLKSSLWS